MMLNEVMQSCLTSLKDYVERRYHCDHLTRFPACIVQAYLSDLHSNAGAGAVLSAEP